MEAARDARVWCLAVAETLIWGATLYLFPALLPWWEADLGWSKTDLAFTFSASLVVSALLSPIAGSIIDRGHGRALLTLSSIAAVGILLIVSGTRDQTVFVACWLALGVCMAGALYEPCFAFLVYTRGDNARHAITLVTLMAGFAGTLSFPLNTFVADAAGWPAAVQTYAALTLVIVVPCFWYGASGHAAVSENAHASESENAEVQENAPANPGVPSQATRTANTPRSAMTNRNAAHRSLWGDEAFVRAFKTPAFWLIATAFALIYLNHGTVISHLLPMLKERGIGLEYAVFTISLIGPSQVAGRVVMLFMERWLSMQLIAVLSLMSVAAAGLCVVLSHKIPELLIAFAVLQGCGVGVSSITRPVVTTELLGTRSFGAISGAIALPVMLCMAFAPSTGAAIWSAGGYDVVFSTNLVLAAAAAVLLLIAVRIGPAPWVRSGPG